jgi:hypothetical protein
LTRMPRGANLAALFLASVIKANLAKLQAMTNGAPTEEWCK